MHQLKTTNVEVVAREEWRYQRERIPRRRVKQSMSRRSYCHDNAEGKSFRSRLKTEPRDGGSLPRLAEARLKFAYYNAERRHPSLDY